MPRLPIVQRDQVPEQFREAFDELTAATGGTISGGPGSIIINSPEMMRRRAHLTSYLRYESTFGGNLRELAILTAARAMDCQYVWNAHAPLARQAGVGDDLISAMRDKKPLPPLSADETALLNYGREFFQNHKVSQATFQAALDRFGAQHLVELTTLMAHYVQTSFILNAFEVSLPAQRTEPVLPV